MNGSELKEFRKITGFSQQKLANMLGIKSGRTIRRMESGDWCVSKRVSNAILTQLPFIAYHPVDLSACDIEDYLEKMSIKSHHTGCMVWQGLLLRGYGHVLAKTSGGIKFVKAHRLSYETKKEKIPDGLFACHKCDNKKCINPDHIFLGTHQDNMDDMNKKKKSKKVENTY